MDRKASPRSYFEFDGGVDAFARSFSEFLNQAYKVHVGRFISPENTQVFHHGGSWSHPANPEIVGDVEPKVHSAVLEAGFDRIVQGDLSLIPESIGSIVKQMGAQFFTSVFSTVSEACNASGNVVDAKVEGSLPASFVAMLEKIEFFVDKDGNVRMPELHANAETAQRMIAALEAEPPEFQARVEEIKERKIAEAREREAARKAKFVRYGE